MIDDIELLRLIENNARLSSAEIATMLGSSEDEVNSEIDRLKDDNIILGYNTVINWEKKAPDNCIGMIEVRIAPVKNKGYDHIAQILSKYDKVTACYLVSGGFDLMIIYEDSTLRNIANFVTEKIATLDGVLSTTTHFILKKYKANGLIYQQIKFCDYWGYERAAAFHIMEEEYGYPVLSVDRPYVVRSSGQLRTRIQAFVERVELKGVLADGKSIR